MKTSLEVPPVGIEVRPATEGLWQRKQSPSRELNGLCAMCAEDVLGLLRIKSVSSAKAGRPYYVRPGLRCLPIAHEEVISACLQHRPGSPHDR
jgi:hypothetical protein